MATQQKKEKKAGIQSRKNPVRYFIIGLSIVALAGGVAVGIGVSQNRNTQAQAPQAAAAQQQLSQQLAGRPMLGSPTAPVTIIEFADFQCPYCKDFEQQVFPKLKQQFIDTGKAKLYFVNLPFLGPDSFTAAEIGYAVLAKAGASGFFDYYQNVYAHQSVENNGWASPQRLAYLAAQAVPGLDEKQLLKDYPLYAGQVNADKALANKLGVQSTPTVFVNGQKLSNWSYNSVYTGINQAATAKP